MSTTGNAESYIELRGSLSIPDAIHGKSAYEIAVANGFDGTEEEWLLHLERAQSEAVEEAAEQALTDIANDRQTALTDIANDRQTALSDIEQAHTEVTTDAEQALSDIAEAKATMLEEIELAAEIVQTTGDSETAVMSQSAITRKTLHALGKSTDTSINLTDADLAPANSIIRTSDSASIANLPVTADGTLITFRGMPKDDITAPNYADFQIYVTTGSDFWYRIYASSWNGWRNARELKDGAVAESIIADGAVTLDKLATEARAVVDAFVVKGTGTSADAASQGITDANDAEINTIIRYASNCLNIPEYSLSTGVLLTIGNYEGSNSYRQIAFTSKNGVYARANHKGTWSDWAALTLLDDSVTTEKIADGAVTMDKLSSEVQTAIEGETTPDYVITEAERVADLVRSHQDASSITIICHSDRHLTSDSAVAIANEHASQAAAIIAKKVKVDYVVDLGDKVNGAAEEGENDKERMNTINESMFDTRIGVDAHFATTGNHDPLNNSLQLSESQLYPYIAAYCDGMPDTTNRAAGYKYYDDEAKQIRLIVLNTTDIATSTYDRTANPAGFTAAQLRWLCEALDVEAGWKIALLSHHPVDWTYTFDFATLFNALFTAYIGGTTFTYTLDGEEITYNFNGHNAGTIIGNIHGHLHNYLTAQMFEGIPIYRACCPNATPLRNNSYTGKWQEETTIDKIAGTATDTSFLVATFSPATSTIYLDYYGARPVDTKTVNYSL